MRLERSLGIRNGVRDLDHAVRKHSASVDVRLTKVLATIEPPNSEGIALVVDDAAEDVLAVQEPELLAGSDHLTKIDSRFGLKVEVKLEARLRFSSLLDGILDRETSQVGALSSP